MLGDNVLRWVHLPDGGLGPVEWMLAGEWGRALPP